MNETTSIPAVDIAEQQKIATALLVPVLTAGAEPLLKAQADLLASIEATMTNWLHRRHEAVADTQRLVARLHGNTDPAEFLKVQQEWASGMFTRLADDTAAYQSAVLQLVNCARDWFPQGADNATSQAAAATRATGKLHRMAAKAE
jgi:hypothetical protein